MYWPGNEPKACLYTLSEVLCRGIKFHILNSKKLLLYDVDKVNRKLWEGFVSKIETLLSKIKVLFLNILKFWENQNTISKKKSKWKIQYTLKELLFLTMIIKLKKTKYEFEKYFFRLNLDTNVMKNNYVKTRISNSTPAIERGQ